MKTLKDKVQWINYGSDGFIRASYLKQAIKDLKEELVLFKNYQELYYYIDKIMGVWEE